ncbi:MAG TPA: Bax inhibitor-1/YccA family protein [Myxococcota bacterium]|nr:Bax inhibitor-1/YccA family protein [Myxococcota bacterium]HTY19158.1 Bax inhibitor-1/YccA family protein [Myxococcota bacterium]
MASGVAVDERVTSFLRRVYGWMFVGLAVTAVVATAVASSPSIVHALAANPILFWGLMIAQLGLVWGVSARIGSLAPSTAAGLFLLYSALTGVTLSLILLVYTGASIASAFGTSAAMFGALAVYGTTARRSLAGLGQFAFMGLVGVILASIVGIFWRNDTLQLVISLVGVIVFTCLTAYDAQRLKAMALQVDGAQAGSYAVSGALSLYLNFINLFLMLLRLMGGRRN